MKDILLKNMETVADFYFSGIAYSEYIDDDIKKCKSKDGMSPAKKYMFKENLASDAVDIFVYETNDNFVIKKLIIDNNQQIKVTLINNCPQTKIKKSIFKSGLENIRGLWVK